MSKPHLDLTSADTPIYHSPGGDAAQRKTKYLFLWMTKKEFLKTVMTGGVR
jgi:hypothetical protein